MTVIGVLAGVRFETLPALAEFFSAGRLAASEGGIPQKPSAIQNSDRISAERAATPAN